jgi:hypothetical protein
MVSLVVAKDTTGIITTDHIITTTIRRLLLEGARETCDWRNIGVRYLVAKGILMAFSIAFHCVYYGWMGNGVLGYNTAFIAGWTWNCRLHISRRPEAFELSCDATGIASRGLQVF